MPESHFFSKANIDRLRSFDFILFARKVLMSHQFPVNYAFMLLIAAVFLSLASIGFGVLKKHSHRVIKLMV